MGRDPTIGTSRCVFARGGGPDRIRVGKNEFGVHTYAHTISGSSQLVNLRLSSRAALKDPREIQVLPSGGGGENDGPSAESDAGCTVPVVPLEDRTPKC